MKTRLILCFHNHQPVGNFGFVLKEAFEKSYGPLVEVLGSFPEIKFSLHFSGYLLEWLEKNVPSYISDIRALVDSGNVEIINGAYYEPIISNIPRQDAIDQITLYRKKLEDTFGKVSSAAWLAERVWEPHFPEILSAAGIKQIPLDEYHFQYAGLDRVDLSGKFYAEHLDSNVESFPISKTLRYLMPFHPVEEVMEFLKRFPGKLITMADDGEKFGLWPGTHELVYDKGWLRNFLTALREFDDLETVHFGQSNDTDNMGRINIPACSYPEMMEWVLSPSGQDALGELKDHVGEEQKVYIKGGFWSNFSVKYPEINIMLRRMLQISRKFKDSPPEEKMDLFRAQCNCSYWHGVFGGVYIPHLRHAIFEHLIKQSEFGDTIYQRTHLNPGEKDIICEKVGSAAYFSMSGGTIYEWDISKMNRNILSVMTRKEEYYHKRIDMSDTSGVKTIHDGYYLKDKKVELLYDDHPRFSLLDLSVTPGITAAEMYRNEKILNNYGSEKYGSSIIGDSELVFSLEDILRKTIKVSSDGFKINNEILDESKELVQQWNVAISSEDEKIKVLPSNEVYCCGATSDLFTNELILFDKPFDMSLKFTFPEDWRVITYPIRTVSNSESGVEEILQGISVNIFIKEGEYEINI